MSMKAKQPKIPHMTLSDTLLCKMYDEKAYNEMNIIRKNMVGSMKPLKQGA